jgi:hypothetical protein
MPNWEWLRRGASAAALTAVFLMSVYGSAAAQESERATGPLRHAGTTKDAVYFVVGPQPVPNAPFSIWRWRFLKAPNGRFDAVAARTTVDCRNNTQQVTMLEGYGQGRFLRSIPPNAETGAKITPPAGSAFAAVQQEACKPNTSASRKIATDHRNARVLADQMLGMSRPAQSAAAPAAKPASAPVLASAPGGRPSPIYCKAAGAVIAAGHEQAVKMGTILLVMGPDNGASAAELAKLRKSVADSEAKRDRARQVVRQYASAPTPDAKLLAQVRNTLISELEAQLDQCAGSSAPANAQAKPAVSAPAKSVAATTPPVSVKPGWTVSTRGTPDFSDTYIEASQIDPTGRFALVYGCSSKSKVRYVRIYTSAAFEDTTSYAAEVPLKLSIDGKPAGDFSFRFQKMPHFSRVQGARGRSLETVDMIAWSDTKNLDRFLAAMRSAKSSIAVSYFDKSMRFATEPSNASFGNVDTQCGARTSTR